MPRPRPLESVPPQLEEEESSDDEDQLEAERDPLVELFKFPSGIPCRFYLDDSMTADMKTKATQKIKAHGGKVTKHERHANVILVSEAGLAMPFRSKELYYDTNEDPVLQGIYVKRISFLTECTNMRQFKLAKETIKKGMGGPRPRSDGQGPRVRVEYTEEDDDHLCLFLARRIPDPTEGGRMGNEIYKEQAKMVCISLCIINLSC